MVFVNHFNAIATQKNPMDLRVVSFLDGSFLIDRAPHRISYELNIADEAKNRGFFIIQNNLSNESRTPVFIAHPEAS